MGKKEGTKEAPQASLRTLFVRNLPYNTTDHDLRQLFEDVGPVKTGFVVVDPVTKRGRGFG